MPTKLAGLKVFFLALTLGQGGAERQLYYILKVLKDQNVEIHVLSLTRGEYWEKPLRNIGIPVTWVGQSNFRLNRLARILKELHKDPPQIFQSQHLFANLYVAFAAKLLDLHEIGAIRNDGITGIERIGQVAKYMTLHMPKVIAANSQKAIDNVIARGIPEKRLFLLPNVVDTQCFNPGIKTAINPIQLISVGRLVKQKRFDRFLAILHQLHQQYDLPVHGLIVGSGPLRSKLETQAGKLGLLPDIVTFTGRIDDIAPVYQLADIFVLTSDWEGTPNVILEAMASGLPVVATNVGGVADVIQQGKTGFIVNPEDEAEMVQTLRRLTLDAELRKEIGHRAREYVSNYRSLGCLIQYLEELYSLALNSN